MIASCLRLSSSRSTGSSWAELSHQLNNQQQQQQVVARKPSMTMQVPQHALRTARKLRTSCDQGNDLSVVLGGVVGV
jgi:hypothetical protein